LLLALALGAGMVDASNYLGLGLVFTANMTGNTVLLGVALARGSGADAARAVAALAGFCLGGAAGVALTQRRGPWPTRVALTFWLEAAALLALLVAWAVIGVHPVRYWLIGISGIAMGAQSAAVRASDVPGVNTTYMTSTLLNAIARILMRARGVHESPQAVALPGATWITYAAGAVVGAFAVRAWHAPVIAFPLAIVLTVALLAASQHKKAR
jgi:uncharacterized membrane protein YoaK (UPF0700 family)